MENLRIIPHHLQQTNCEQIKENDQNWLFITKRYQQIQPLPLDLEFNLECRARISWVEIELIDELKGTEVELLVADQQCI